MKIKHAEFITSAVNHHGYPEESLPEIAFAGRSNVGKSSLINCLAQRKKLARTSSAPGKTQTLNFYKINTAFYMVDLPGYGYSKAPESVSRTWMGFIDVYFQNRNHLRTVCQLIDLRHEPTQMDLRVSHWLRQHNLLGLTIGVKADKLSRNRQMQYRARIRRILDIPDSDLVISSVVTKAGREEILSFIQTQVQSREMPGDTDGIDS